MLDLKKIASGRAAPQENDAKFRFTIHPQGIRQLDDNSKIAKCHAECYHIGASLYFNLDKHFCSYISMIN